VRLEGRSLYVGDWKPFVADASDSAMNHDSAQTLYQCVPNFSEGRRPAVIAAIAEAIAASPAHG